MIICDYDKEIAFLAFVVGLVFAVLRGAIKIYGIFNKNYCNT